LIIVAALIPVYLLHSLTGTFFRPLVLSYGLAVLALAPRRTDDHAGAEPDPAVAGALERRRSSGRAR
jgi:hypothetical protein